jgi:hypothetical protein
MPRDRLQCSCRSHISARRRRSRHLHPVHCNAKLKSHPSIRFHRGSDAACWFHASARPKYGYSSQRCCATIRARQSKGRQLDSWCSIAPGKALLLKATCVNCPRQANSSLDHKSRFGSNGSGAWGNAPVNFHSNTGVAPGTTCVIGPGRPGCCRAATLQSPPRRPSGRPARRDTAG